MAFLRMTMLAVLLPVIMASKYDLEAIFDCHNDQVIGYIHSKHDNYYEDREWNMKCVDLPVETTLSDCQWTEFVNKFDEPVNFTCENDGVIAGIDSIHDNYYEDRRFKFLCCTAGNYVADKCVMSDYKNEFDLELNYTVPKGKVIRGMFSEHDNFYEDRRFKFDECNLDLVDPVGK